MDLDSALLTLLAVLGLTVCFLRLRSSKMSQQLSLPPGPFEWPVLGCLPSMRRPLHRCFFNLSKQYGPVVYIKMGALQLVCVNDGESCEELYKARDIDFCYRPMSSVYEKWSFGYKGIFGSPYGKYSTTLRKVCSLHLFSTSIMNASEPYRANAVNDKVKEVYDGCQERAVNLVNLRKLSSDCSLNAVSLTLFGEVPHDVFAVMDRVAEAFKDIGLFLGEVFPVLASFCLTKVDKTLTDLMPKLEALLVEQIEKHKARKDAAGDSFKPVDFVDALICLPSEYDVSVIDMVASLLDLFAGGVETSQVLIEYTMGILINHPEVMQKAQEEVARAFEKSQRVPESGLPYIKAILKEVLRLYPPAVIGGPHCNPKETTLAGYRIPAGCKVWANTWAVGHDPKCWKDADKFMPERFLEQEISVLGQHRGYIPFGGGRRSCVGSGLALRFASLVVGTLIHAFDWKPPPGQANIDLTEGAVGLVMVTAKEVVAAATPRLPHHMYDVPAA